MLSWYVRVRLWGDVRLGLGEGGHASGRSGVEIVGVGFEGF